MWPDIINAVFETLAGLLTLLNVRRIIIDKEVRGISMIPITLFTLWGIWNLYYYPHLGQWFSFVGGLFIMLTNLTWVSLAVYYGGWRIFKRW